MIFSLKSTAADAQPTDEFCTKKTASTTLKTEVMFEQILQLLVDGQAAQTGRLQRIEARLLEMQRAQTDAAEQAGRWRLQHETAHQQSVLSTERQLNAVVEKQTDAANRLLAALSNDIGVLRRVIVGVDNQTNALLRRADADQTQLVESVVGQLRLATTDRGRSGDCPSPDAAEEVRTAVAGAVERLGKTLMTNLTNVVEENGYRVRAEVTQRILQQWQMQSAALDNVSSALQTTLHSVVDRNAAEQMRNLTSSVEHLRDVVLDNRVRTQRSAERIVDAIGATQRKLGVNVSRELADAVAESARTSIVELRSVCARNNVTEELRKIVGDFVHRGVGTRNELVVDAVPSDFRVVVRTVLDELRGEIGADMQDTAVAVATVMNSTTEDLNRRLQLLLDMLQPIPDTMARVENVSRAMMEQVRNDVRVCGGELRVEVRSASDVTRDLIQVASTSHARQMTEVLKQLDDITAKSRLDGGSNCSTTITHTADSQVDGTVTTGIAEQLRDYVRTATVNISTAFDIGTNSVMAAQDRRWHETALMLGQMSSLLGVIHNDSSAMLQQLKGESSNAGRQHKEMQQTIDKLSSTLADVAQNATLSITTQLDHVLGDALLRHLRRNTCDDNATADIRTIVQSGLSDLSTAIVNLSSDQRAQTQRTDARLSTLADQLEQLNATNAVARQRTVDEMRDVIEAGDAKYAEHLHLAVVNLTTVWAGISTDASAQQLRNVRDIVQLLHRVNAVLSLVRNDTTALSWLTQSAIDAGTSQRNDLLLAVDNLTAASVVAGVNAERSQQQLTNRTLEAISDQLSRLRDTGKSIVDELRTSIETVVQSSAAEQTAVVATAIRNESVALNAKITTVSTAEKQHIDQIVGLLRPMLERLGQLHEATKSMTQHMKSDLENVVTSNAILQRVELVSAIGNMSTAVDAALGNVTAAQRRAVREEVVATLGPVEHQLALLRTEGNATERRLRTAQDGVRRACDAGTEEIRLAVGHISADSASAIGAPVRESLTLQRRFAEQLAAVLADAESIRHHIEEDLPGAIRSSGIDRREELRSAVQNLSTVVDDKVSAALTPQGRDVSRVLDALGPMAVLLTQLREADDAMSRQIRSIQHYFPSNVTNCTGTYWVESAVALSV